MWVEWWLRQKVQRPSKNAQSTYLKIRIEMATCATWEEAVRLARVGDRADGDEEKEGKKVAFRLEGCVDGLALPAW